MKPFIKIQDGDFALMVDMIGAFFQGGGLAVPGAEELIDPILQGIDVFPVNQRICIRESHFPGAAYNVRSYKGRTQNFLHVDEINRGKVVLAPHAVFTLEELRAVAIRHTFQKIMLWNEHAVDGTEETQLHPQLRDLKFRLDFVKGQNRLIHSYSPFYDDLMQPTGLGNLLRTLGVHRTFSFGLAGDFCAGLCALHAAWEGFESFLVETWCRNIDIPGVGGQPGTVEAMNRKLDQAGVYRFNLEMLDLI